MVLQHYQILSYRQYFAVNLLYSDESESDIASRLVQKESNLMFTLSSITDHNYAQAVFRVRVQSHGQS